MTMVTLDAALLAGILTTTALNLAFQAKMLGRLNVVETKVDERTLSTSEETA